MSLVVAIAVFFAPTAAAANAARASVPNHAMQMMESGHCKSIPASDHEKAPAKTCCVAMCMAIQAIAVTHVSENFVHQTPTNFAVRKLHLGYLGEIATPPPRLV